MRVRVRVKGVRRSTGTCSFVRGRGRVAKGVGEGEGDGQEVRGDGQVRGEGCK